jgi:hypothetical protein
MTNVPHNYKYKYVRVGFGLPHVVDVTRSRRQKPSMQAARRTRKRRSHRLFTAIEYNLMLHAGGRRCSSQGGRGNGGIGYLALLITMSIGVSHRRSLLGSWASGFVPSDLQTHVHAALARPPHFCRSVRRGSSQG